MSAPLDANQSHAVAFTVLDAILEDFGIQRHNNGSSVEFRGDVPAPRTTMSEQVNLTLVGAIPALANAIVATQIYEARGGLPQRIEVDLRKAHNYLDPDTGMTPTLNGQVCVSIWCSLIPNKTNSAVYGQLNTDRGKGDPT